MYIGIAKALISLDPRSSRSLMPASKRIKTVTTPLMRIISPVLINLSENSANLTSIVENSVIININLPGSC